MGVDGVSALDRICGCILTKGKADIAVERRWVGGGGEHLGEISHGYRHNSRLHITTTPSVAATTIATTSRREGDGCGSAE